MQIEKRIYLILGFLVVGIFLGGYGLYVFQVSVDGGLICPDSCGIGYVLILVGAILGGIVGIIFGALVVAVISGISKQRHN
jgi:hypothetical protein